MIGHDIKVTVIVIAGDKVRIGIDAPLEVEVHREEVYLEIQEANRRAASASAEGVSGLPPVLRDQGDTTTGDAPGGPGPQASEDQAPDRGVSGSAAR
jgi:carbon storage regulator